MENSSRACSDESDADHVVSGRLSRSEYIQRCGRLFSSYCVSGLLSARSESDQGGSRRGTALLIIMSSHRPCVHAQVSSLQFDL